MAEPRPPTYLLTEIARVHSTRDVAVDDEWGSVEARLVLAPDLDEAVLAGLDAFSHLEVLFVFDRVDPAAVCRGARHPRSNAAWPSVGIFAQRAKDRPNRLGLTTCEILGVHGTEIAVRGLDAVDGTPIVDLKPYFAEFAPRTPVRQPTWSHELMAHYFD